MKRFFQSSLLLLAMLVSGTVAWAADVAYSPVLDVNFRTAAGNTGWQTVKNAADEGNTDFELTSTAGFFALQKYTVADLQNTTKLVLTLTVGSKSGVDAVRLWSLPLTDWTAESGIDDIYPKVQEVLGVDLRATEGTANEPLVKAAKVANSNPAKATLTITGTALATIKANAAADGTFTLLLTNDNLTNSNNKRSYLSNNTANDEANRPVLVATVETPAVKNVQTGATYSNLTDAFNAAVTAGTDAELEVYEDLTLTSRLTLNKAMTLTITPKADITIKGHRNAIWFLANVNNAAIYIGGDDHTITLDGQGNTFEYDVTKYENSAVISLTNVTFQNFDLNNVGHLVGSKANEGQIILDRVTFKNCVNPADAFINKLRVTNDRLVLKGWLNQESCTGTTVYAASETKSSGTTGRIKIDDDSFTANAPITINWPGTKAEGIVVAIGTSATNAALFQLTDADWTLERKSNGDLVMAKPVTPTAQIGTTGYADLAAALAAVQDGETITLLGDQEVSSRINVKNMSITIDGQSQYTIKRASSYTNGLVFLTQKADEGYASALTLQNIVLDGSSVETTAAFIEAGNNGTTTLRNVTVQNVTTTADAAIINKGGGKLVLNGVTFTNGSAAKADVFEGTSLTLKGENTIPTIYVEKQLTLTATGATFTTPVELKTDATREVGLIVVGGSAGDFTCASFRLSQQGSDVYAMPLSVAGSYTHPGLLHTAADIARVKANLSVEPFKSAYTQLEAVSGGTPAGAVEYLKRLDADNWSGVYSDYANYTRAATDARLAYDLALRYQLKGSTAAATQAVSILNDWAQNCKGVLRISGKNYTNNIPDPNEYLLCIQAYQFANAAELLRDYSGWQATDFYEFQNWMRSTFADLAWQFLENHHDNDNALHYWLNWDLAALTAMYSVGVLCDDASLVDYALSYTTNGTGTGNVANAIVATHQDPDSDETLAQCQESGRDQGHSTLDVTLLGAFCQMAQSQGTDLFTPYKALEMAEYVAKYNLKNDLDAFAYTDADLPFTTYNNSEVSHTVISGEGRGTVRPSYELFLAYAYQNDKAARYVQQQSEWARRQNAYGEANSTSTDELGFGTLMYMSADKADYGYVLTVTAAGAATLVLPFEATIPAGVKAWTISYTAGDATAKATAVETTIPANTPILVEAAEGLYTFTAQTIWQGGTSTTDALVGVYSKTIVPEGAYILTSTDDGLGFRKVDGTTNFVEANRAYLTAESNAARIAISFGDDTTTGIGEIENGKLKTEDGVYDLQGRRMESSMLKKGLYIVNGKKVLVK